MNLRPGNLPNWLLDQSLRAGFGDSLPTKGFSKMLSLKSFTTAAIAKTPPRRSYKVFSVPSIVYPPLYGISM
jgi:hypothetical protein